MAAQNNPRATLRKTAALLAAALLASASFAQQNRPAQADALYSQSKWRDAAAAYEAFAAANPDDPQLTRVYMRIGQARAALDELEPARKAFAKAVELNPDDSYALSIVSLWGNLYARRYQYREALVMCENLIAAYPNTRAAEYAQYAVGTYLEMSGADAEQIAAAYNRFLETYPQSIYHRSAVSRLITLYLQAGEAENAEKLLRDRLNRSPDDAELLRQLSDVYQQLGRSDDAARLLEEALRRKPNDPKLMEALGATYAAKGDRDKAREIWLRSVNPQNDNYNQRLQIGYLFQKHGFFDDAIEQYERAAALQPTFAYLYTRLAGVYQITGKPDKALEAYLQGLLRVGHLHTSRRSILSNIAEHFPKERLRQEYESFAANPARLSSLTGLLTAAELAFLAGKYDISLNRLKGLAGQIDTGGALEQFGQKLLEEGQSERGLQFLNASIEQFQNSPDLARRHAAVAEAQRSLGMYEESAASYRAAIARDPGRIYATDADTRLAEIYLRGMRRPDAALQYIRSAAQLSAASAQQDSLSLLAAEAMLYIGQTAEAGAELSQRSYAAPEIEARRLFLLAEMLLFEGDRAGAEKAYKDLSEAYLEASSANDALERIALIQNAADNDEALKRYAEALILRANGKLAQAMTLCERSAEAANGAPIARDASALLAEIALEAGEPLRAAAAYETLADAGGHLGAQALSALGRLYQESGNRAGAMDAYERLLKQQPTGAFAVSARARLRTLMDETNDQETKEKPTP